jgi:hypothetical protein|tara:strand:+ start:16170 stop:17291 length:1122 start_codon:yes stop_codon:yes gene_type:complete
LQVVFVHGVNTRDLGDGEYERWVSGRSDRLRRLAFGGKADIRNPYWGKFGLATKSLLSLPSGRREVGPLSAGPKSLSAADDRIVAVARHDFEAAIGSLSAAAIARVTLNGSEDARHAIEDFWMAVAEYAEDEPAPVWLAEVSSTGQLVARLRREVTLANATFSLSSGAQTGGTKPLALPAFDGNAFAADRARALMSGYLAQFVGDALMFFARRDTSLEVRRAITEEIVGAARVARSNSQPLVLIGYSMGGGILHELLTDPTEVAAMETQLGAALEIDLFLSVGTQIGLFAELGQFAVPGDGKPLAVPINHYWNVYDYHDTLAFLCGPVLEGAEDFEVKTAAGVVNAHGAYFDSALFFRRLHLKLVEVGLVNSS